MFRVANFAQQQLNMANIMRTQSHVADTHIQISSGKKSQDYATISTNSFELVSIERSIDRTVQFKENIDRTQMRLEVMESSIATMSDRATEVLSIISQALSGDNMADIPLQQFATTFSTEVEALLNTQIEGRYLFSGTQTDTVPVDINDAAYTPQAGLPGTFTADTGYYQGDTAILSVRADDNFELDYGITADDTAFEELLRALSYMDYAGANSDITVLEESFSLMKSALDGAERSTGSNRRQLKGPVEDQRGPRRLPDPCREHGIGDRRCRYRAGDDGNVICRGTASGFLPGVVPDLKPQPASVSLIDR